MVPCSYVNSYSVAELQVTSIIKTDGFNYGAGVTKWHSLVVGSTTHLVGLGSSNVVLLTGTFVAPDVGTGHTYSLSEESIGKACWVSVWFGKFFTSR